MLSIAQKQQQQTQSNAYNQLIDNLTNQANQSKNPEFFYQTMAVAHFKHNQPDKGLDAVKLCKNWSKKNGTPVTKIYLAIFKRAEYLASTHETANLERAKKDLLKISGLTDIPKVNKDKIEDLHKAVEQELEKIQAVIPDVKAINDICIIPKQGYSFYGANLARYINNIKRSATVPEDLKFIEFINTKGIFATAETMDLFLLELHRDEQLKDIIRSINYAQDHLENDDDEFLNTGIPKDHWKNNLRGALKALCKLIKSGIATKQTCAECYFYIGHIHNIFEDYLSGIYNFSVAAGLCPNVDFNAKIDNFFTILYEMKPKERLKWIDIAISEKAKDLMIDKDLLLWKAEAHFLLDQYEEGRVIAQVLLRYINKSDPQYEFVFKMANS